MKVGGILFAFAAIVALVSATNCWEQYTYTGGWNTQSFWLCVLGSNHGSIYSVSPPGYQYGSGRMLKVELTSFTYSSPYPATLTCYEQFTDVEPPSRMGSKSGFGTLNSIPQGPLYSWHMLQQVTLEDSDSTSMSSAWVLAGCPPIQNTQHQPGSPPQVYISTNWVGFGTNRATAIAAPVPPIAISAFPPYLSYGESAISANDGVTANVFKNVKRRR